MMYGPHNMYGYKGDHRRKWTSRDEMKWRRTLRRRERRARRREEKEAAELQDCPNSKDDRGHCPHWWDGDGCCWCDSGPISQEEMIQDGMIEGPADPVAQAQRVAEWQERRNKKDQQNVRTDPGRVGELADEPGIQRDPSED